MITNGMWNVFSLTDPHNHEKKWNILLNDSHLTLDDVKRHVNTLKKDSTVDQYVMQKLTWPGVYLRRILSIKKVLIIATMGATALKVYVSTTTINISDSYDALEDTINHLKSPRLKIFLG